MFERTRTGVKGRVVEAEVIKGEKIAFFDDVVSERLSKIEGVKSLENKDAVIKHLIVVDREHGRRKKLE